jgi:SET domain-containing protein
MMTVRTELKMSDLHGLGCFALEDIPKGQKVWEFNELIDSVIPKEFFDNAPKFYQDYLLFFAEYEDGYFVLCGDNGKFWNHSEDANLKLISLPETEEWYVFATKEIKKGEELLYDYRNFKQEKLGSGLFPVTEL